MATPNNKNKSNNGGENGGDGDELLQVDLTDSSEKMVEVRCMVDHKAHIGGRQYIMRKHGSYTMPVSDADILQQANIVIKK